MVTATPTDVSGTPPDLPAPNLSAQDLPAPNLPAYWADPNPADPGEAVGGAAIRAIAGVLFATHEGPPPEDRLRWLAARVHDHRARVGGRGMLVFRIAVFAAMWIAPLWSFRLPTLSRLPHEARVEVLDRWERSPAGMSLFAIKAILCIIWFEHPAEAEAIGFDGLPLTPDPARGSLHG